MGDHQVVAELAHVAEANIEYTLPCRRQGPICPFITHYSCLLVVVYINITRMQLTKYKDCWKLQDGSGEEETAI